MNHKSIVVKIIYGVCILVALPLFATGCGIKVKQADAQTLMKKVFNARKSGNARKELALYAKKDFSIVSFKAFEKKHYHIMGRVGRFKSVKALKHQTHTRNQLGKGMVKYLVLNYEVTYSQMKTKESFYFLGSSEKPKLVYATFDL